MANKFLNVNFIGSKRCNRILANFILKMRHTGHLYFTKPIQRTEILTKKLHTQCLNKNLRPYCKAAENDELIQEILKINSSKDSKKCTKSIYKSIRDLASQWLHEEGVSSTMEKIESLPFEILKINIPSKVALTPAKIKKIYEDHNLSELEALLDYKFRQPFWILCALNHKASLYSNITGSYMNMAFFGDAVMNVFLYLYLIEKSKSSKKDFTQMVSDLRSNKVYSEIGADLGLKKFLIRTSDNSSTLLQNFSNTSKEHADLLEAIAGALFVDMDLDMEKFYPKMSSLISHKLEKLSVKNL